MESAIVLIFQLAVLLMSVVIHEFAHGWMAYQLGDQTAKNYGRLTLNPLKHLDLMGSLIVPLGLFVLSGGSMIFGWAKPVPFNPYNLRDQRYGAAKVAGAGPVANFLIALIFGLALRFLSSLAPANSFVWNSLGQIFGLIVFINILLAIFNLIPLPPLDGSKILFTFAPRSWNNLLGLLEQYGMIILLLVIFLGFDWVYYLVLFVFRLLVGQAGVF